TVARRLTVPSGLVISVNVSHEPTAARFATSGLLPAFSAHTYSPVALLRSATLPPESVTTSNRSAVVPAVVALAIRLPAAVLTNLLFARERNAVPAGCGLLRGVQSAVTAPPANRRPPSSSRVKFESA